MEEELGSRRNSESHSTRSLPLFLTALLIILLFKGDHPYLPFASSALHTRAACPSDNNQTQNPQNAFLNLLSLTYEEHMPNTRPRLEGSWWKPPSRMCEIDCSTLCVVTPFTPSSWRTKIKYHKHCGKRLVPKTFRKHSKSCVFESLLHHFDGRTRTSLISLTSFLLIRYSSFVTFKLEHSAFF